jgi:hypothetical protein
MVGWHNSVELGDLFDEVGWDKAAPALWNKRTPENDLENK